MSTKNCALSLAGVVKRFPGFTLDHVTLALEPGSIMGFLGPNGAGKTTTMKLILNMLHLDAGEIRVFGLDSRDSEIQVKRNIGYVGESAVLPPDGDAQWLGRFLRACYPSWDERLYKGYLHRFLVPQDKPSKSLSKGTRTKLALAAALGHRPKLLVLDEPTSGLDPIVRHEVVTAVSEIAHEGGRAVFFSSHIVSDLEACADCVTVISEGKILTSERTKSLLSHWRRISVVGISPRDGVSFSEGLLAVQAHGGLLTAVTPSYSEGQIANLARQGGRVVEATPLTLEEVFRHMVDASRSSREEVIGH